MNAGTIARTIVMLLGCSGVACTAIVFANLDKIKDYELDDGGRSPSSSSSGSSSSSSGQVEVPECSLLKTSQNYAPPAKDNACAQCIESKCEADVSYACNEGQRSPKQWFTELKRCAQNPYDGFPDPESDADYSWGCGLYKTVEEPIAGSDDAAKRRASEICVHDSCLQGEEPACRRCEVFKKKTGSEDVQRLRDDPCGQCFTQNCNVVLVDCCNTNPMDDYIAPCAYTQDKANLRKCGEVGDAGKDPDSGYYFKPSGSNYDSAAKTCAYKLGQCFNTHCAKKPECQDN